MIVMGQTWAGKMVTCIRLEHPPKSIVLTPRAQEMAIWLIDRELQWSTDGKPGVVMPYCPDEYLMPIRPEPDTEDLETTQEICAEE